MLTQATTRRRQRSRSDVISFTVYGRAEPAGSKTAGVTKTGRRYVRDANPSAADWKRHVRATAGEHMAGRRLLLGPVSLTIVFHVKRAAGHYGTGRNAGQLRPSAPAYPTIKPDVDKLARGTTDALTGIIWRDDSQVVERHVYKYYADSGLVRAEITARELQGSP